jgi:two-component system NtrC family sensor kinase
MGVDSVAGQQPTPEGGMVDWLHRLLQAGQLAAMQAPAQCYREMLAQIMAAFGGNSGWLALYTEGGDLEIVAAGGLPPQVLGKRLRLESQAIVHAAATAEPLTLCGDLLNGTASLGERSATASTPCALKCWPLLGHRGLIGVFNVDCAGEFHVDQLGRDGSHSLISIVSMVVQSALLLQAQERRIQEQERTEQELELAHRQLLQREKMASIGQLAAGVAHEINNPVGYINANINTLRHYQKELYRLLDYYEAQEPGLDDKRRQALADFKLGMGLSEIRQDLTDLLDETAEGVQRVRTIVKNLRDFAHPDDGTWQFADLHQELEATLNVASNEIKYKAQVIREYAELPQVECLPSQLNQVFMNLLVNAAHAIEDTGVIRLRSGRQGDEVWVEVGDTGKGIAAEDLPRIFEPFFTTKSLGKGTGLGLAVSYGIIEKHCGRIEVDSRPGEGSRFRVWLPFSQAADKRPRPSRG